MTLGQSCLPHRFALSIQAAILNGYYTRIDFRTMTSEEIELEYSRFSMLQRARKKGNPKESLSLTKGILCAFYNDLGCHHFCISDCSGLKDIGTGVNGKERKISLRGSYELLQGKVDKFILFLILAFY